MSDNLSRNVAKEWSQSVDIFRSWPLLNLFDLVRDRLQVGEEEGIWKAARFVVYQRYTATLSSVPTLFKCNIL